MKEVKDSNLYDDIINMRRPMSGKYPQMSMYDRAAQFSPFSALTGHKEAIAETARETEGQVYLEEEAKIRLNQKLQIIRENLDKRNEVTITYFEPDDRKSGGAYNVCTGAIKKVDEYKHNVIMEDNTIISIYKIKEIEGEIFCEWEWVE